MLSIANLNQYYGGSHILRDVAFEVPDGKCTALLGRNGVGKTTLLKCLMGLLPIRSGDIRLATHSIATLPLGSNRSLHLVRAGADYLLVGSAEHGVAPIHRYTEQQAREAGLVDDNPPPDEEQPGERGGGPIQMPGQVNGLLERLREWTVRR